eukprot:33699-Karenia_brevis.AAC.1
MDEYKDKYWDQLYEYTSKHRPYKQIYIMGDFNARVQSKEDPEERCIGPYTFDKNNNRLAGQSEDAANNRSRFIGYCNHFSLQIMNTYYKKWDAQLVTYREIANNYGHPYTR